MAAMCAGTWVKGVKDGSQREVYLHQVVDNDDCLQRLGCGASAAQTAFTPVILMELIAADRWPYTGVRCAEMCEPDPYVALMADYGFAGGLLEMESEFRSRQEQARFSAPLGS